MKNIIAVLLILTFAGFCTNENTSKIPSGVITYSALFTDEMSTDVSCYRIPALITAPDGTLIVAADERVESCADLRTNQNINIVIRRSSDNGVTWSECETVVNYPYGTSASDPSMIVDKETNVIFLFYNFMDHNKESGIYYLHVIKSQDNGKTWSEPENITSQITKSDWYSDFKFITSGRGIQTQTGTLLHTLVNLEKGLYLFGSRDHGKSWFLIDTPIRPADESKVVESVDGSWLINSRVNKGGMRYIHISEDYGNTWKTMSQPELADPGCNASLIRYTSVKDGFEKNRLLFSNANMENNRKNMTVRLSYDEGNNWTVGKTIYAGSAAYSSLTVMENEEIGLLFEKDNYKEIAFVRFSLQWVTNGEDRIEKAENK